MDGVHIWLNGPFGVGKTAVAHAIVRLRPGARLVDPEAIGHRLRRESVEARRAADFRDLPAWRAETVRALAEAAPGTLLVVPMTVPDRAMLDAILGPLAAQGIAFGHFTLIAPAGTVRRRIRRRLDWPGAKRWALAHLEPDLAALAAPAFAPHIATDGRPVRAIAEEILALAEGRRAPPA